MIKTFETRGVILDDKIPGSKYFSWHEALWLNSIKAFALPDRQQKDNIIETAIALDKVRAYYNQPIHITSWLRPNLYNKLIGGALRSWHTTGRAVDFMVRGEKSAWVRKELRQRPDIWPGRGEIADIPHVHLDLGGKTWFNI